MKIRGFEGWKIRGLVLRERRSEGWLTFKPSNPQTLPNGFTLIELLIVITIIGMMFSVSLPVSWSMYQRYQASLKAEKILTLVSTLRMDAFLYGRERLIQSQDGKLVVDGADVDDFKDIFIQINEPITFYKAGTTSGGEIKIYAGDNTFVIEVQAPLGGITMKTG